MKTQNQIWRNLSGIVFTRPVKELLKEAIQRELKTATN